MTLEERYEMNKLEAEANGTAQLINEALAKGEYKAAIVAWTRLNLACDEAKDHNPAIIAHGKISDIAKWIKAITETNPPGFDNDPDWYNEGIGDNNERL